MKLANHFVMLSVLEEILVVDSRIDYNGEAMFSVLINCKVRFVRAFSGCTKRNFLDKNAYRGAVFKNVSRPEGKCPKMIKFRQRISSPENHILTIFLSFL